MTRRPLSIVSNTRFGLIRRIGIIGGGFFYLVEMPCGALERINEEQFQGRLSVNHGAICASGCGYHETHEFAAAVDANGGWRTL